MARHRHIKTEPQEDPAMDISSMIDCCFLLLIYFLVATTLVSEKQITIAIPGQSQSTGGAPPPLDPGRITVNADGSIIWGDDVSAGTAYTVDAKPNSPEYTEQRKMTELVSHLKDLKATAATADQDPIIILSGAALAPHQRIVDVMSALATVGIKTVGLNTTPAKE